MTTRTYPEVGESLPAVVLSGFDGRKVDLAQFRGRRHIIFMWASW